MCGIAGFYGFRDDNLIREISQQLTHRGPDGEGYFLSDNVTLLNRRLAIIDIKGGHQPIYNEDKSLVVVYNGEIYNYLQLREDLIKDNHLFVTDCDTEVIVHAYEKWGEACFDKFNGMFAIALYDIKKNKLILARDHFGIKPLYFSILDDKKKVKIIFSSEIKPIFYSGLVQQKPNDKVIYRYLKFRLHDDGEETFFDGIYRLKPGELMIIDDSKWEIKSYTNLKNQLLEKSHRKKLTKELTEKFTQKLIESIRKRLVSEVPVGSCLSGGLDSSTIVALINKLLAKKVEEVGSVGKIQKTFSAVFPGFSNNEEKYIDELINHLKFEVKNYKAYPNMDTFFKEAETFVKIQEEPTISTGPYAQYKLMEEVKKQVTVVLDGQGADESLAGYLPYYFVYFRQLLKEKKFLKLIKEVFFAKDVFFYFLSKKILNLLKKEKRISVDKLLNPQFSQKFFSQTFSPINDNLKRRLVEDIFYNSLPSLLRYEDKNSMHFSIESRLPFLDFDLLKYLFSLPDEAIIKDGWNKFILRQAMKNFLPKKILARRNKIGFTTPEYDWFFAKKDEILKIFLSDSFAKRKYFNQKAVLQAFQEFIDGKIDDTMIFWRLINLELWLRVFFDKGAVKKVEKVEENLQPNKGKKLAVKIAQKIYFRYPIKTKIIKKGDDIVNLITDYVIWALKKINLKKSQFMVVVSEKIVAISQGRSYFIWEITPSFLAKFLSKFVSKSPYGIGLGSPWTMQLAINEVGWGRIFLATIGALLTKPLGIKGIFYRIAGREAASIDGPTSYSLYPSNFSAKLGPKNPEKVAKEIAKNINLSLVSFNQELTSQFLGVSIIDANDLGQNVLGNASKLSNQLIEKIFSDNPMGQSDEQTPLVLVVIGDK